MAKAKITVTQAWQDALAGDKLSVWLASDNTGTVTAPNANVTVQMIEDTSI